MYKMQEYRAHIAIVICDYVKMTNQVRGYFVYMMVWGHAAPKNTFFTHISSSNDKS